MVAVNIDDLKNELSRLDIRMTEILADAKTNGGGNLTEEQREEYDSLDKKYDEKYNYLTASESGSKRKSDLATTGGRQTQPDAIGKGAWPAGHPALGGFAGSAALAGRANLQTGGMASLSGRRYSDLFGGESQQLSSNKNGFESFDAFLEAVQAKQKDTRLQKVEFLASREGVASDGGFLVPEEFSSELLDASLENEIVRPRADVRPMNSQIKKIGGITHSDASGGSLFGGFTARWLEEGGTATDETAKARQIQLTARKLFIYSLTSNELLADGEDFESQMTGALIQAMGWHLDDSYLNGSGSNQPLGVLNDPATHGDERYNWNRRLSCPRDARNRYRFHVADSAGRFHRKSADAGK